MTMRQRICVGMRPRRGVRLSVSEGITLVLAALFLWLTVKDPTAAAEAARGGLALSARSVIPALFPFFALSYLLTESGVGERLGAPLKRPIRYLFGVSEEGVTALLLGAFCGFPIGARCVSLLYGGGRISKGEAERLLILSNHPSFAFLYSAVGAGYFGDKRFGLILYGSVLLASFLIGILLRVLFGPCEAASGYGKRPDSPSPAGLMTGAVASSVASALSVTGYVVFFTVVSEALSRSLAALGATSALTVTLTGLLELTAGAKKAAETVCGLCGRILCGFFAGFGGLCAALQVIATVEHPLPDRAVGKKLSFRSYFVCKFLEGVLTALLVLLFSRV